MADRERERLIAAARQAMALACTAGDAHVARAHYRCMRRLIRQRSPERVARMGRE